MNTIIQLIAFAFLTTTNAVPTDIDSSEDQTKVEQAVVQWANALFTHHEDYKFEHFKAFYTDEYFIQTSRIEMYTEKVEALEQKKANGTYEGSEENYTSTLKKLNSAIENAKSSMGKIDRVTHYQTHFWSNIQTKDGITVYYELILKLDNNYSVFEAVENSSIGKKNGDSKIAYKKAAEAVRVVEK